MFCQNCETASNGKMSYAVVRSDTNVDLHCGKCSFTSPNLKSLPDIKGVNILYGDWHFYEVVRLISAMKTRTNLRFFKGRKLFTFWRDGSELSQLVAAKDLLEIIKAV